MRDYSKVVSGFWTGETGRALRGDGDAQVLAFYLMTSPHANMLGLYYLPIPLICHETGMPIERASEALRKLIDMGFADYDEESEFIWVFEMALHQVGEQIKAGDKRVIAIRKMYMSLSNNSFLKAFYDRYAEIFHLDRPRHPKGTGSPSEDHGKPTGSREQEQEQEHEQSVDTANAVSTAGLANAKPAGKKKGNSKTGKENSSIRRKPAKFDPLDVEIFEYFVSRKLAFYPSSPVPGNGTGKTNEVERAKWIAAARGLRVNRGRPPEEIKAVIDFLFSDDSPAWLRESVTGLPTLASAKSTDFYARLHASYLESGKTGMSNSRLRHAEMRHCVNKPGKYVSPAVE